MNIKFVLIAVLFAFSATNATKSQAETRNSGTLSTSAAIPETLQASVKAALQRISRSPNANAILVDAVQARYGEAVRSMLIQNGVDANALAAIVIDANGAGMGPRKALPQTIYFAVSTATTTSGTPVGLVYMGYPYGWVDWNTFDPWAYF